MRLKTVIMAALVGLSAASANAMAEDCVRQAGVAPASFVPPALPLIEPPHFAAIMPQLPDALTARELREEGYGKALLDEQLAQTQREQVAMARQMQQMMAKVQRAGDAFRGYRPTTPSRESQPRVRDTYRDELSASQREQAAEALASLPRPTAPEMPGLKVQLEAERDAMRQQMEEYRDAMRAAYLPHRGTVRAPAADSVRAWRARMLEQQHGAAEQQQATLQRQLKTLQRCVPATAAAPSTNEKG